MAPNTTEKQQNSPISKIKNQQTNIFCRAGIDPDSTHNYAIIPTMALISPQETDMCEMLHIHVAAVNHQCARMQHITRDGLLNQRDEKRKAVNNKWIFTGTICSKL